MKVVNGLLVGSAIVFGGAFLLSSSIFTVYAGHRALIFDNISGVKEKVYGEGIHLKIPVIQVPIDFDVRVTPRNIRTETGSKDLQKVQVNLRVLYRPDYERIHEIYVSLGLTYDDIVLPGIANEVTKAVFAQFNVEELVTQRDTVSKNIKQELVERASAYGIILEDVALTHISFSKEYTSAIEQKQVAQQNAEKQKFILEKSRQEKDAEVILAEGETEAAKLIQESMLQGNEFLELRRIEASKEIAEVLSKGRAVTYLPSRSNTLLTLPPSSH
jgi:prohibitin 1